MIEGYYVTSKALLAHHLEHGISPVEQDLVGSGSIKCIYTTPFYPTSFSTKELLENTLDEVKPYIEFEILKVTIHGEYQDIYYGIISFDHIYPRDIEVVTNQIPPMDHDPRVIPVIINDEKIGEYRISEEDFNKLKEEVMR